jgi:ABC-type nitrate/sulfonate/bicarbonate transport system substrate-binding protein
MRFSYKSRNSKIGIAVFFFWIFATDHSSIRGAIAADRFTYAVAFPGATNAYFHIGKARGFFSQQNIEVLPILMSIPTAHAALVSGQIDGQSYTPSTVRRGAPEVQVFSLNRTAGWFLLAKPSIKDIKELPGKTVTAGSVGGMAVELTKLSLVQVGLDPKSVIFLGGRGAGMVRYQMLLSGTVDAAILNAPFNRLAQEKGFNVIADFSTVPLVQNGLTVSRPSLKEKKPLLKRFLSAMVRSLVHTMSSRLETVSWFMKNASVSRDDAENIFDTMVKTSTSYGLPPKEGVTNRVKVSGVAMNEVGDWYDFSILREVLAEMGITPDGAK